MTKIIRTLTLTAISLCITGAGFANSAHADTKWQNNHPRREQVNGRLNNQNHRIHQEVKEGDLTKQQAGALHHEDHQIRQEERDMASQNGSHLTTQEQKTLNQQENQVSQQIGR